MKVYSAGTQRVRRGYAGGTQGLLREGGACTFALRPRYCENDSFSFPDVSDSTVGALPTVYPASYAAAQDEANFDMSAAPGRTYKYYTGPYSTRILGSFVKPFPNSNE